MRYMNFGLIMFLLWSCDLLGQCGTGNLKTREVDCCGGTRFVRVCQGISGQCNPLATILSCTSTCGVFQAGECLSAKSTRPLGEFDLTKELTQLQSNEFQAAFPGCGPNASAVFKEWLLHTGTKL
jgi:hypothetical protein